MLVAEALSIKADRKVEVSVPARGERREVMLAAVQNARAQLARQQAENATERALLEGVAETFGLERRPSASRSTTTPMCKARMRSAR